VRGELRGLSLRMPASVRSKIGWRHVKSDIRNFADDDDVRDIKLIEHAGTIPESGQRYVLPFTMRDMERIRHIAYSRW